MARTTISVVLALAALLAGCNFPGVIDGGPELLPIETSVALTLAAVGGDPAPAETAPAAPTETPALLTAEYPTVTLDGGSGYLFDGAHIMVQAGDSPVDRDVWWNAAGFVPNTNMRSLGVVDSLTPIDSVTLVEMSFGEFAVQQGEAFLVEVDRERDGTVEAYALIRVLGVVDRMVTFEYVYPFGGALLP